MLRSNKINQTCYYTQGKALQIYIKIHQNKIKIISQKNACAYKCMTYLTYLTTPQHLCINVWLYHMHVHDISKKELKRNPNLTCKEQIKQ